MKYQSIYCFCFLTLAIIRLTASEKFVSPVSPHEIFNFNPGWKFYKGDLTNAERLDFDDSKWPDVAAPHTFNDVDSYQKIISHSGGDRGAWSGIVLYRKHFKLPAGAKDGKVFLEFEGLKQAGRFWVNGRFAGKYENGVTPLGLDLTRFVNFGGKENVIAVKVDNSENYVEQATGVPFQWMTRDFNPNYGGLNHDIWLHLTGKIYQTLPLYENLKTTGIYIYGANFDIKNKSCDVNIESQVRNESGDQQSITLSAVVVDADGRVCAKFRGDTSDLVDGETEIFKVTGKLENAKFWSDVNPYLYNVYTMLTVNDKVVDVQKITTGFRKAEFKGGTGTGGVYLNDKFVWLTGYAQYSENDWAGLGEAYPDWMHDYNAQLIRSTHANYIRWMHISPQAVDVRACDKAGIVEVCPAGDKESDPVLNPRLQPDAATRQWEQRVEVMCDAMIYFRNNPSILFWEAGGTVITTNHMQQMVALRKQWDPNGGRVIGTRGNDVADLNNALTPLSEFYGVMISQDPRSDAILTPGKIFRGYSVDRRDRAPLIETEDFREEAARRFWDDYSPPFFGFKPGPNDTWHLNSETFCLAAAARYDDYFSNIITNTDPAHSKWSAYASIYWSDANADGRQDSSEVCRVSGKVDSVRLPKQAYYVYRVMQNDAPDIHIIGHWNYPTNTTKTIYVAANHCDSVELFVNGKSVGETNKPFNFVDSYDNKNYGNTGCIFAFPEVAFNPGKISAVAKSGGKIVAQGEIETAGAPVKIKLTPHIGPDGLQADGSDVAFFDVEVVDVQGRRCPTDEARVDFKLDGPAIWRGGYNSGKANSINNLYLDTECGINRVAIRSTLTPGTITLTARCDGFEPSTVKIESRPMVITDGLMPAGNY
jgi:beta-galactosidase